MAGTLVIDTLQDGSGNSTSATNAIQGCAKAWVNFNGVTTAAIRASYNVSSVVRNGVGEYTVNFTNAMTDANYAVACTSISAGRVGSVSNSFASTATGVSVVSSTGAGAAADSATFCVAIFR